jgi:RHS repeat-associated protein
MTTSAVCANTATFLGYLNTGKERDTESGNDYFGARYYASTMGRWLSPDWSAKREPVPYAKLDNPQSLNLYAYVFNNPLIHIDADGHIIDDNALKDNKDYQGWKKNYLSHKGAQAQWDTLNNNKDLTVTMKWDSKGSRSVTDGYQWNGQGQLTAATVTLAAKTGDVNNKMSSDQGYVHGADISNNSDRQAYVMAHEFGHVEFAQTEIGLQELTFGQAMDEKMKASVAQLGMKEYLKQSWVGPVQDLLNMMGHEHELEADQRGWDVIGGKN